MDEKLSGLQQELRAFYLKAVVDLQIEMYGELSQVQPVRTSTDIAVLHDSWKKIAIVPAMEVLNKRRTLLKYVAITHTHT